MIVTIQSCLNRCAEGELGCESFTRFVSAQHLLSRYEDS